MTDGMTQVTAAPRYAVVAANTTVSDRPGDQGGQAIAAYLLPGRCSYTTASTAGGSFQTMLPHLEGTSADTAGPVSRQ